MDQKIIDRFNKFLTPCSTTGAIYFTGSRTRDGYGQFVTTKHKHVAAHRIAWEIANGPIPEGMCVCHKHEDLGRHNVNPYHLFLGTQKQNMADMIAKGRQSHPTKTHCKHGHEFTEENSYISSTNNARNCRTCRAQSCKAYQERKRQS